MLFLVQELAIPLGKGSILACGNTAEREEVFLVQSRMENTYSSDDSQSTTPVGPKFMKVLTNENLANAIQSWYTQQRFSSVTVRGVGLHLAAEKLHKALRTQEFKTSNCWLWHFNSHKFAANH